MRVKSTPAERSARRSGSIAISPTVRPMLRTRRRTDLPTNEELEEFLEARAFAGGGRRLDRHVPRRAGRMSAGTPPFSTWTLLTACLTKLRLRCQDGNTT